LNSALEILRQNKRDVLLFGIVSIEGGASRAFYIAAPSIEYVRCCNQRRGRTRTDTKPNVSLPASFRTEYKKQTDLREKEGK